MKSLKNSCFVSQTINFPQSREILAFPPFSKYIIDLWSKILEIRLSVNIVLYNILEIMWCVLRLCVPWRSYNWRKYLLYRRYYTLFREHFQTRNYYYIPNVDWKLGYNERFILLYSNKLHLKFPHREILSGN